jgi:DNA-binding MarR family transcriptional regulator
MAAERPMKHQSVGRALVQATRLHRNRMGDKLSSLGLFAGQEQVLQALAASGLITMGELASILRVRQPTTSKTVSRLAAMGLVERQSDPNDARVVRVQLTAEGLTKADAIGHLWDEVEAELLDTFDGKDRKRLRKLLRKVATNLAKAAGSDLRGLDGPDDLDDELAPAPSVPVPTLAGTDLKPLHYQLVRKVD